MSNIHLTPDIRMSIVIVTPNRFAQLRKTVGLLAAQTAVEVCELIIVAPTTDAVSDRLPEETGAFARTKVVDVGPIPDVDRASAHGIRAAESPIVAIVEDHVFPERGWAAAILDAYANHDPIAVGPIVLNGNPRTQLSWANLLLAYGTWTDPVGAVSACTLPLHNLTMRRDALLDYGSDLEDTLGRGGSLMDDLQNGDALLHVETRAHLAHVNPSRFVSTARLRFNAGRLYGAGRADGEDWQAWKRALYIAGAPLIPAVRLARVVGEHGPGPYGSRLPSVMGGMLYALGCDAVGQAVGYANGAGDSLEMLSTFEMGRRQHLCRRDRDVLPA